MDTKYNPMQKDTFNEDLGAPAEFADITDAQVAVEEKALTALIEKSRQEFEPNED